MSNFVFHFMNFAKSLETEHLLIYLLMSKHNRSVNVAWNSFSSNFRFSLTNSFLEASSRKIRIAFIYFDRPSDTSEKI